jgi:hypothetical protein
MFDQLYVRQKCFGGLSLVMLGERLDFVGSHLLGLLQHPTDVEQLGILYHLLHFLASMIEQRREADRRSKQRSQGQHQDGSHLVNDLQDRQTSLDNPIQRGEIAEEVCKHQIIHCQCGKFKADLEVLGFDDGVCSARVFCKSRGCNFSKDIEFAAESIMGLFGPS